jgi:hypothetical protein
MMSLRRVTRKSPCPICGKERYCYFAANGRKIVCCFDMNLDLVERDQNDRPRTDKKGHYIHRVPDMLSAKQIREAKKSKNGKIPPREVFNLHKLYCSKLSPQGLNKLAGSLGLSPDSLDRMDVGTDGVNWTFPMKNGKGYVIGIRKRSSGGKKFAYKGSRVGIFIPNGLKPDKVLFIAEGSTDTAALLDLGIPAIGRPSCNGGGDYIKKFLSRYQPMLVTIMADRDPPKIKSDGSKWKPGQVGAYKLARDIRSKVRGVKVVKPAAGKDIREWKQKGATKESVMLIVQNTRYIE